MPESQSSGDRRADWTLCAAAIADSIGRCDHSGIRRDVALSHAVKASFVNLVEGAILQAKRPIKQDVVVNDVLVIQPNSATHHRLAVFARIPGNPQLRSEVEIGLSNGIAVAGECRVNLWNGRQIAIRPACVAVVTKTQADGKVGLNLPRIADVETNSVIRSQSTSGKTQGRRKGVKAESVSESYVLHGVIQRIGIATRIRSGSSKGRTGASARSGKGANAIRVGSAVGRYSIGKAWGGSVEVSETSALDVIERHTIAQDVRVNRLAAVILQLMIRLRGALRSQQVRAKPQSAGRRTDLDPEV